MNMESVENSFDIKYFCSENNIDLSTDQLNYLQELFVLEEDWVKLSGTEKSEIGKAIKERAFEIAESSEIDLNKIQSYIPEYLLTQNLEQSVYFEKIDEMCENAEQISLEDVKKYSPELADQISSMQERLGNECPDGIMNTLVYYRTNDGTLIIRSNSEDFKNSHIIIKGKDAYCVAGDRNDDNHLNEFINEKKLMPNFTYHVDGHQTYKTDNLGRVVYLKEVYLHGEVGERSSTMRQNHQRDLNNIRNEKDGRPNGLDHAGHLAAYDYNGPTEGINIVPMSSNLNKGGWRNMEMEVKSGIENKNDVSLEKYIKYEGDSFRPTEIDVSCTIKDKNVIYHFDNT